MITNTSTVCMIKVKAGRRSRQSGIKNGNSLFRRVDDERALHAHELDKPDNIESFLYGVGNVHGKGLLQAS